MGLGLNLSVLFNFMSIKMYGIAPMPLYLYFPSMAILILSIIDVLLPLGIRIHEMSVSLKWKWGRYLGHPVDREYICRKMRALQPLCINCGLTGFKFFKLSKSTKVWFYEQLLTNTITALL